MGDVHYMTPEYLRILKMYVNPAIYCLIAVIGLVWNGALIFMFIRHKEIRTSANVMIINLAVSDVLNLGVALPILCIFHFPHENPDNVPGCRAHLLARFFLTSLSALSLVALSVQRFCITVPNLHFRLISSPIFCKPTTFNKLYVLVVWILSLVVSLPFVLIRGTYSYLCGSDNNSRPTRVVVLCYFILYSVLLPTVMIVLSILTAQRLRRSAIEIPSALLPKSQVKVRRKSATIVTSLAVLFLMSHLPFWLWSVTSYWTDPDRESTLVVVTEYVTKYLLFTDSCFNPIALYMASGTFRRLFKRYLWCSAEVIKVEQSIATISTSLPQQLTYTSRV